MKSGRFRRRSDVIKTASEATGPAELDPRGLSKHFGSFRAVVSLSDKKGEFITILGASGSAMTPTLMIIAGFDYPTRGVVCFRGRNITYMSPHQRNMRIVLQS
jgi:putative spermidine/putrescine transport system ATP-binding protein